MASVSEAAMKTAEASNSRSPLVVADHRHWICFLRIFTHRTRARLWRLGRRRRVAGFVLFADHRAGDAVFDSAGLAAFTPTPRNKSRAFPASNFFRQFGEPCGALALARHRVRH